VSGTVDPTEGCARNGAHSAPAGVRIEPLPVERLDEIEPLWRAVLEHLVDLDSVVPIRPPDESWPKRKAHYTEYLEEPDSFLLVAVRDEAIVGYVMVHGQEWDEVWNTAPRFAEIETLSVAEGERGKGIGSALLDAVEAELELLGIDDVVIGVDSVNEAARLLYERRGFTVGFHLMHGRLSEREQKRESERARSDGKATKAEP
jgi:ribosomal protein S18 acetylase RimI-like enzyme